MTDRIQLEGDFVMRLEIAVASLATFCSHAALAGSIDQFGTLTNAFGDEISFDAGEGNSNTNFLYQNHTVGASNITMGLSAQTYFGGGNAPLRNDGNGTFYAQAGPDQSGSPSALAGSGSWAFKWSVTASNDSQAGFVPNDIYMALRIDGPSGGNWGSLDSNFSQEVVGYPGSPGSTANQQVWTVAYDFMQLDSGTLTGGASPGIWDGMGYNFNELGTYSIQIRAWDNSSGSLVEIGTVSMSVEVVPGIGGLAVFGGLGLAGRRRRR